jgi:hypothetical protein
MKRFFILFEMCALLFFFASPVFSQEEPETEDEPELAPPATAENEEFIYKANQKGDQFLRMALMGDFPIIPDMKHMYFGGSLSIGYMYFLNGVFAIGGDVAFGFNGTIGGNMSLTIPIMFKAMYQPTIGKFEIPITVGIGGVVETYLGRTYFGFGVKPEVAVYYRITASWSAGLSGGVFILPQWYTNKDYNKTGIIADVGLTARFHF